MGIGPHSSIIIIFCLFFIFILGLFLLTLVSYVIGHACAALSYALIKTRLIDWLTSLVSSPLADTIRLSASVITVELRRAVFGATVCKTVRPMLSDRCLFCLSVLSVTFVHCGQTVGRIKMALDTEVGLSPGDFVLDGNQPPPQKGGGVTSNE